MPKHTKSSHGKRVNVYLRGKSLRTAKQIDNLSAFFQLCLDIAPDIMAWDILREDDPTLQTGRKLEDHIDDFNAKHPLDPLTAKRKKAWPKNSPNKSELW